LDKTVSKANALFEAWKRGLLSWKLDSAQKELYELFYKSSHKTQVWLLSRRAGKSYTLLILALEQCYRKPNSIVKFVSPTKIQVNNNVRPVIREILEDCPQELKPRYSGKDYIYYFPNGSEIQLAGTDNGHVEKLRGVSSDLCIIDEAGSCSDLFNVVKNVLLPTTLITKGKILLAGTPPKESDHPFIEYVENAEAKGALVKKTVFENPRLSKEQVDELIAELGGIKSESARRELLVEIIKDSSIYVLPEFTAELQAEIVKEWPTPPFYDCYEAMDIGFKDLTVVLFGYYDFRAGKLIIEDELVVDFNKQEENVGKLVQYIQQKEKDRWYNYLTNEIKEVLLRVSDINYIVTKEISIASQQKINFLAAQKDDLDAAINNLRTMLSAKKIIIHPRCETLIRHLRNVRWYSDNNRKVFARSNDNGHYDAVEALKILVRHVNYNKNPYPSTYDLNMNDLFIANPNKFKTNSTEDIYRTLYNVKGNGKFRTMQPRHLNKK
jgi:hypothetical protein